MSSDDPISQLEEALLAVDEAEAESIVMRCVQELTPLDCAERVVSPALRRIGAGWEEGKVALSQVYIAGKICERMLDRLLPETHQTRRQRPRMAIANLEDYHNLGQKIVWSVVRASGFEIENYGRMDAASLAQKAGREGIEVLFVSTLMLRSALRVEELRNRLSKEASRPWLVVGGAPFLFDTELWQRVGADEMGAEASAAVEVARRRAGGTA